MQGRTARKRLICSFVGGGLDFEAYLMHKSLHQSVCRQMGDFMTEKSMFTDLKNWQPPSGSVSSSRPCHIRPRSSRWKIVRTSPSFKKSGRDEFVIPERSARFLVVRWSFPSFLCKTYMSIWPSFQVAIILSIRSFLQDSIHLVASN
jgi:hypothetical protein